MGGFWNGLGHVAEEFAKRRYNNSRIGRTVNDAVDSVRWGKDQTIPDAGAPPVPPTPQPVDMPGDEMDPAMARYKQAAQGMNLGTNVDQYGPNGLLGAVDNFGQGKIVTKPTIARLAEKGIPEMVIPLNGKSDNMTDGAMVQSPHPVRGSVGVRYRRPM